MRKIVLTGATSPVGTVVQENLQHDYSILPISLTGGWDLTDLTHYKQVIYETKDAYAFINCAYIGYYQGYLLAESQADINISFGSLITKVKWQHAKNIVDLEYIKNKLFLQHIHKQLSNSALINISSFGSSTIVPNVTDNQLLIPIKQILDGDIDLPAEIDIENGKGNLEYY